jgi:hypothetical protein
VLIVTDLGGAASDVGLVQGASVAPHLLVGLFPYRSGRPVGAVLLAASGFRAAHSNERPPEFR